MSKFNEKLLTAWYEREIPDSEFFELTEPLDNIDGEERTNYQNSIADTITKKYPLRDLNIGKPDTPEVMETKGQSMNGL